MLSNITLRLVDGVQIVVPDSLDLITSYVLREQEDWFEDEIKFVRHLVRPGQRIIDIGANYGIYTLTMARLVGPTGQVWAFEPAAGTADVLAASLAVNNFSNVTLIRSALSKEPGVAQLAVHENSELNELVRGQHFAGASETVSCVTLDDSSDSHGWKDIDFIKMDAEGEEANILKGGAKFLATESPLIQFEIKDGTGALHIDLAQQFAALGYRSYRLVPGLNLLVPFDAAATVDSFLLNLFCCKPDRAARLAAQGLLVEEVSDIPSAVELDSDAVANGWQEMLGKLPYGQLLAKSWAQQMAGHQNDEVREPLFHYARSRDTSLPPAERFAALETSYQGFQRLCNTKAAGLRLSSLARVAVDYGARAVAVNALDQLCNLLFEQGRLNMTEPFLAPGVRFDTVAPPNQESVAKWVAAGAFEELERIRAYSSYYVGKPALRRLEFIRDLGFASDEMKRRLALVKQRAGIQSA